MIEPSNRTAAATGIWTMFGFVPFNIWMDLHQGGTQFTNNLLHLIAVAIFFFIPVYYFVIGSDIDRFSWTWFLDSEGRGHFAIVVKRMFVWFMAAAILDCIWSPLLSFFSKK